MKQPVITPSAPAPIGPFSQAITCNGMIYVSGQLPIDLTTGELSQGDMGQQTRLVMSHIAAIVEAAGSNLDKLLKTTILLTNLGDFAQVNEAYAQCFTGPPPARACYQVAALPKGARIEIEAICAL